MSETEPEKRRHISFSQLKMFQNCGKAYEYRYIEGKIIPPGVALIRGRSVHKAHEISLRRKLEGAEPASEAEMEQIAADEVENGFRGDFIVDDDIPFEDAKGTTKDQAVKLARLDQRELIPQIKPIAVEEKIEVEIPGLSKTLLGILDVAEYGRVRDLKTSSRTPPKDASSKSAQLSMYHLLFEIKYGKPPGELMLDTLVATKEPKLDQQKSWRMKEEIQIFLNRVHSAVENIEKGNFLPAPEDAWNCSAKWCGFWSICPFGGSGRKRPVT